MPFITVPVNYGPAQGETLVSVNQKGFLNSDGTVAVGQAIVDMNAQMLDVEIMNIAMMMLANDEEDVESTQDIDGVTYLGITPGFK